MPGGMNSQGESATKIKLRLRCYKNPKGEIPEHLCQPSLTTPKKNISSGSEIFQILTVVCTTHLLSTELKYMMGFCLSTELWAFMESMKIPTFSINN